MEHGRIMLSFTKSNKDKRSVKTKPNNKISHFFDSSYGWQTSTTDLLKPGQTQMRPLCSVRLISFLTTEVTIKVKFKMSASTYINRGVR